MYLFKSQKGEEVGTALLYSNIVEHIIVMDMLYLNSMINHCLQKKLF